MINMIPFHTTNWDLVPTVEHPGLRGAALWRTVKLGKVRVRLVEYSSGYLPDHWCARGHILYCLRGEITTHTDSGEVVTLREGMSYQVSNGSSRHKSESASGALLLIVDGDFLDVPKTTYQNPWRM